MLKKDNYGFVATAVLYTITILLAMVIFVILRNVATTRKIVSESSNDVRDDLLTYEVVYDANGGEGTVMENSIFTYGKEETLSACAYTKTGYDCDGFSTTATGDLLTNSVYNLTQPNMKITLYAFYTPKTFLVTFDANRGTVTQTSTTVTYDSTYGTLPTPTRSGYNFKGWYTATSGGSQVTDATIVKILADQTLYAQWKANSQKIAVRFPDSGDCWYSPDYLSHDSYVEIEGSGTSSSIYMNCYSSGDRGYGAYSMSVKSTDLVNVAEYNKLKVDFENHSYGGGNIGRKIRVELLSGNTVVASAESNSSGNGTLTVDTSQLTGTYYLRYYIYNNCNWNNSTKIGARARFYMPTLTN